MVRKNQKTDLPRAAIGGRFCFVDKGTGNYVTIEATEEAY
jgi:hypothetical protein